MVVFKGTNRFKLSHKSLTIATLYLIHTNFIDLGTEQSHDRSAIARFL